MPKAYSYIRWSTPEQSKGDSSRRQIALAEAYAKEHDLELDERLTDSGLSAFHGAHKAHGELGRFLAAVEGGTVPRGSVLIVESLDRLSREDVFAAFTQLSELVRSGIEVVTLSDGQRYSEASLEDLGRLLMSIVVMSRAHEESAMKSERVAAAWASKRKRALDGEAMTKRCVGWCRIENGRYALIPERAEVIRRIFQETIDGVGKQQLAKRLTAGKVETWGKSQGWHASYIQKVLENEAVLGLYQPHRMAHGKRVPDGPAIPDYYPAVVAPEIYWAAAAARHGRQGKGGNLGGSVSNLLHGVCRCACGATMVHVNKGKPPKGGRYLVCDRLRRGLGCTTPDSRWWPYKDAEVAVLAGLLDGRIAPMDRGVELAGLEAAVSESQARLDDALRKEKRWLDEFEAEADDPLVMERFHLAKAAAYEARKALKAAEAALTKFREQPVPVDDFRAVLTEALRLSSGNGIPDAYLHRSRLSELIRGSLKELRFTAATVTAIDRQGRETRIVQVIRKSPGARSHKARPKVQIDTDRAGCVLPPRRSRARAAPFPCP